MSLNLLRPTGWVKEPEDPRDLPQTGFKAVVSEGDHQIPWSPYVRSQSGGACVANAWCGVLDCLAAVAGQWAKPRSEHALYWQSRKLSGWENDDSGTFIRMAARVLREQGVGAQEGWNPNDGDIFTKPHAFYWGSAFDGRLSAHYKIADGDIDAVDDALMSNHPVVFGVDVDSAFMAGKQPVFDAPNGSVGRHAMCVLGGRGTGNDRQYRILNSWSKDWGDEGLCQITAAYLRTARDVWVGTRHAT